MTTNGVRPARTLPPGTSGAQWERAMRMLAKAALASIEPFYEAEQVAYGMDNGDNTKVSGGSTDPTLDTVVAGLANEDDEPDRWIRDREALRSAVMAGATALRHMGLAGGRLNRIIRTHERSGNAIGEKSGKASSQSWTAREAEARSAEFEHRPVAKEATDRRFWGRRRG